MTWMINGKEIYDYVIEGEVAKLLGRDGEVVDEVDMDGLLKIWLEDMDAKGKE